MAGLPMPPKAAPKTAPKSEPPAPKAKTKGRPKGSKNTPKPDKFAAMRQSLKDMRK